MSNLLAVPVLLCLFGAAATFLAGRHPRLQRAGLGHGGGGGVGVVAGSAGGG